MSKNPFIVFESRATFPKQCLDFIISFVLSFCSVLPSQSFQRYSFAGRIDQDLLQTLPVQSNGLQEIEVIGLCYATSTAQHQALYQLKKLPI